MISGSHNLTKNERLCSKKLIKELITKGISFTIYPLKVTWLVLPQIHASDSLLPTPNSQLMVTVPSHRIRKAVNRNKIKRRMREAFRKNKKSYYECLKKKNKHVIFAIFYNSSELLPYSDIETKIILILQRLIQLISKE